jgi:hypothetical protein
VSLADDLLDHASRLLAAPAAADIDDRRVVSASYYAAFHLISAAVAEQVSPQEPVGLRGRCQRALEHRAMKNVMARFLTPDSVKKLSEEVAVPCAFSHDIAMIANAFGELQDERHLADYDVVDAKGKVGLAWASESLDKAKQRCFWQQSFLVISGRSSPNNPKDFKHANDFQNC